MMYSGSWRVVLTLCAFVDELSAILDEVPWDVHKLLKLVRHICDVMVRRGTERMFSDPIEECC